MNAANVNQKNNVLTKFSKYYDSLFTNGKHGGLKVSLSSEFNDVFDSQLYPDDEFFNKQVLTKYPELSKEMFEFYLKRLNNVCSIVSFSRKSAIDVNSSNLWGLYANNGSGVALEFDYHEMDERFNSRSFNNMIDYVNNNNKFYQYENLKNYLNNNSNFMLLINNLKAMNQTEDMQSFIKMLQSPIYEHTLNYIIEFVKLSNLDKVQDKAHLHEVKYTDDYLNKLYIGLDSQLLKESKYESEDKFYNDIIEENILNFFINKSISWEHENEYRILDVYKYRQYYLDHLNENSTFEECKRLLEDYIHECTNNLQFKNYNDTPYNDIQDVYGGQFAIGCTYLPYPQKIYLGWNFSNNDINQITTIKSFCNNHNIELYELEKYTTQSLQNFNYKKIL